MAFWRIKSSPPVFFFLPAHKPTFRNRCSFAVLHFLFLRIWKKNIALLGAPNRMYNGILQLKTSKNDFCLVIHPLYLFDVGLFFYCHHVLISMAWRRKGKIYGTGLIENRLFNEISLEALVAWVRGREFPIRHAGNSSVSQKFLIESVTWWRQSVAPSVEKTTAKSHKQDGTISDKPSSRIIVANAALRRDMAALSVT